MKPVNWSKKHRAMFGVGLLSVGAISTAIAQEESLSEVVVTGSRLIQNGFQAPTPVTVITVEQLQATAPSTLSDALNQLPVFNNSFKAASTGPGVVSNAGGAYLNARSLGANRNLVLLDGRRVVPSSVSGSVAGATDINIIPQALVQRVDVVTGGASAAYGSDAVSGVVNFALDTRFTGVKGEVQGGVSDKGDNQSRRLSLTFGTPMAGGRGHLLLSGEYYNSDGVENFQDRDWANLGYANIRTPATLPQTSTSNPTRAIVPNVRPSDRTSGGLILAAATPGGAAPLAGNYFNADGTLSAFPFGTLRTATTMSGGGIERDFGVDYPNLPALVRGYLFSRASYDFTPSWTGYLEGLYASSENNYFGGYSNQTFTIQRDNAYLRPEVRTAMGASTSLRLGRINTDFGGREELSRNETFRAVAGIDGKLGAWDLKFYYTHGDSRQDLQDGHNVITANLTRSVDAIVAAAGNPGGVAAGTTTCRALVSADAAVRAAAAGCVPINVQGANTANASAVAYFTGDNWQRQHIKQDVADFVISGSPFSTWAGPLSVGTGISYRKEQVVATADPIGTARGFESSNLTPLAGEIDVNEAFVETLVPLLADKPFAQALDLNAAVRYADYSTSGGVTSWKAGLTYRPTDELRLRATRSRDVRAANLNELYTGPVSVRPPVTDPFRNSESNANVTTVSVGNPNLEAEQGDTFTAGIVYSPAWAAGLTGSVDFYNIKLTNTIGTLGGGQIVAQCFAGATQLCPLIVRAPATPGSTLPGAITTINNPFLNVGKAHVRGMDFELGYRKPLWGGNMNVRLLATHVLEQSTRVQGAVTLTDQVGRIGGSIPSGFGGSADWTGTLNVGYEHGPFSISVQERYIGSGVIDNTVDDNGKPLPSTAAVNANLTGNGLVPNAISAWYYTDATLKFKFGSDRRSEVYLTVNNVLDKDPARIPSFFFYGTLATNAQIYDTIGRTYTAGIRFTL
ncbi:MAG: TonB-dependent receptor [Pseudomonadota bacterium]